MLRIFYFDLFDPERGVYRVLDIVPRRRRLPRRRGVDGAPRLLVGARDARRRRAGPSCAFETLVPDVRAYFPTADDVAALDELLGQ